MHNKIGFADIAPRFRQMPTSSYRPITLILLIKEDDHADENEHEVDDDELGRLGISIKV